MAQESHKLRVRMGGVDYRSADSRSFGSPGNVGESVSRLKRLWPKRGQRVSRASTGGATALGEIELKAVRPMPADRDLSRSRKSLQMPGSAHILESERSAERVREPRGN